jgi:hypothetical protein
VDLPNALGVHANYQEVDEGTTSDDDGVFAFAQRFKVTVI